MTMPGFTAETSVYKTNKSYFMGPAIGHSATVQPQQLAFYERYPSIIVGWLEDCLMGCAQSHTACVRNISDCAVACQPGCVAGCQIRCLSRPWWQQLDCLASCGGNCIDSCSSSCGIACDAAYSGCVNSCYPHVAIRVYPDLGLR